MVGRDVSLWKTYYPSFSLRKKVSIDHSSNNCERRQLVFSSGSAYLRAVLMKLSSGMCIENEDRKIGILNHDFKQNPSAEKERRARRVRRRRRRRRSMKLPSPLQPISKIKSKAYSLLYPGIFQSTSLWFNELRFSLTSILHFGRSTIFGKFI